MIQLRWRNWTSQYIYQNHKMSNVDLSWKLVKELNCVYRVSQSIRETEASREQKRTMENMTRSLWGIMGKVCTPQAKIGI